MSPRWMLLALAAILGACAGQAPSPQAMQALQVACRVDAVGQPLAVAVAAPVIVVVAPEVAAEVALATTLDTKLAHPAIIAACAAIGGTPQGLVGPQTTQQ